MNTDRMIDNILLASGLSPRDILLDHYRVLSRTAKTAAEGDSYRLAALRIAKMPWTFIYDLAKASGSSLLSLIKMFKNSKVVAFFSKVKWSLDYLLGLVKDGWKAWKRLHVVIGEYLANTKVGKWTKEELAKLDAWLEVHPVVKKIGGPVLAGMLLYLWFNMAFSGDPEFDFDMSDVISALGGGYVLTDMFAGPNGMRFLLSVVLGMSLGLSFPWPGSTSVQFIISVLKTLGDKVGVSLKKTSPKKIEEEAKDLIPSFG